MRHPSISRRIARELFLGDYEREEIELVSRHLAPDDVVLEVGTGLGVLATLCALRIGSHSVYTYEANPSLIALARETFARNAVAPRLTNALLGARNGLHPFHLADDFWASSAYVASTHTIQVPMLELNGELANIHPSFLIVDIAGGEAEFFARAELNGVRKICVETHPEIIGDIALTEMLTHLLCQGFVLHFSTANKSVLYLERKHGA